MSLAGEGLIRDLERRHTRSARRHLRVAQPRAHARTCRHRPRFPPRSAQLSRDRGRRRVLHPVRDRYAAGTHRQRLHPRELNTPAPWTQRSIVGFLDTSRSLCRVAVSVGTGQGGLLVTYRHDVAPAGREEEQRCLLAHQVLPALADSPGVVPGRTWDRLTASPPAVQTAEKKDSPPVLVPNCVILVEGGSEVPPLLAACDTTLPATRLIAAGAVLHRFCVGCISFNTPG